MDKKSFMKSGHLPTLFSAFLYFDVSFMVWVLFGPMTPFIADQMHLSATQKGLLTAIPLLGGSFFRPILGLLADRIGGRRAGLTGLMLTLIPLILGWRYASTLWHFYLIGFLLGIAGASFAVALPLAGRWYPAEHQGLAMGIAGAGNSGTLIATFFGPRIAQHYGWHFVFGLALGSHRTRACSILLPGQEPSFQVGSEAMGQVCAAVHSGGHLETLLSLQPYLWWVCWFGKFSIGLLSRPIPPDESASGRLYDSSSVGRQLFASGRWLARRQDRRVPTLTRDFFRCCYMPYNG